MSFNLLSSSKTPESRTVETIDRLSAVPHHPGVVRDPNLNFIDFANSNKEETRSQRSSSFDTSSHMLFSDSRRKERSTSDTKTPETAHVLAQRGRTPPKLNESQS